MHGSSLATLLGVSALRAMIGPVPSPTFEIALIDIAPVVQHGFFNSGPVPADWLDARGHGGYALISHPTRLYRRSNFPQYYTSSGSFPFVAIHSGCLSWKLKRAKISLKQAL